MQKEFLAKIKNPPKEYRPIPFWSWNDKLDVEKTREQIKKMDQAGIGGYFMHARSGLQTPYLEEEWMENITVGIEEGKKRSMGAWAYDENGWPSGFGDGRVLARGEEYYQKYLRYRILDKTEEAEKIQENRIITQVTLANGQILQFYYDVNQFYVDCLDSKVIKAFIDDIYQSYAEQFPNELGQGLPGFFTDEPQLSRNGIPWSLILPSEYQKAYGEDLLPLLPELFMEIDSYQRTRYRFWHLVQELFVTSYTQQIYEWCDKHGAMLTGHMIYEETLLGQLTANVAVMPHYEFFHIPAMDWLGRHIDPPTTPLQVSSVAHQLGKKHVLSETFALTGWNVSFEELRWMFEWQMVRGVTLLCQHLQGYTLRGVRKRDYPPSLFYQQPWWDDYKIFNDFVSRAGMLLSQGTVEFDVLVIHPQSSAWVLFDNVNSKEIEKLHNEFETVTRTLESAHIAFHYGDERIIKRYGSVTEQNFKVGCQSYQVVVVPPTITLAKETVELLNQFVQVGGLVIWVKQKPTLVDGENSKTLTGLLDQGIFVTEMDQLIDRLPLSLKSVSVTNLDGQRITDIYATKRKLTPDITGVACEFYYFTNSSSECDYQGVIKLPGKDVVMVDLEHGSIRTIPYEVDVANLVIKHKFHRRSSLALFVFPQQVSNLKVQENQLISESIPLDMKELGGLWDVEMIDSNALTLDYCDFWFDGQLQAENEHISVIQERAVNLERPVRIKLRFPFKVASDFQEQQMFLIMETPEKFKITINGKVVSNQDCGYYRDQAFRKIDIRGCLQIGENELFLETDFKQSPQVYQQMRDARVFEAMKNKLTYDSEIEAVYLVGDFGVNTPGKYDYLPRRASVYEGDFEIGAIPKQVNPEDLTYQGFPFFNGKIRLSKRFSLNENEVKERSINIKHKDANSVAVIVNGRPVKEWFWRPYHAILDGYLVEGENTISLELTSGLRNLLGPHHWRDGECYNVRPPAFFKEPNVWGNWPWTDKYHFVKLGVTL